MVEFRALMQPHPTPSFADPILADLVERARVAQVVAATAQSVAANAQSAVWAYIDQCQQGTAAPELDGWPIHADHPDLLTGAQAAARAGRHVDTVSRWCRKHGVGKLYGGRWRVSIRRLNALLAQLSE